MRTLSPSRIASKPSIRTSSSSSSTSLSGRGPLGLTLVESSSCGRGPCCGLGLIVKRDEADPASRIPCRGGGGDGWTTGAGGGAGVFSAFLACGAVLGLAVEARLRGAARFAAVAAAGRVAVRARDAWARARGRFLARFLEELTPEFPDPAEWVRHGFQGYDRRPIRVLAMTHGNHRGKAFGVDPDHPAVNPSLLNHEGANAGVSLEATCARDLEAVGRDDVSAHDARDRDRDAADLRLHVRFGTDHEITVAFDLAAEAAEHLT